MEDTAASENNDDLNVFMMCEQIETAACSEMPEKFIVRPMSIGDLDVWKRFPFDTTEDAKDFELFMTEFFTSAYGRDEEVFFRSTLFVCDQDEKPVATCGIWRAYDDFTTVQWLKVLPSHEGLGIARALLSIVLRRLHENDFPIYLHTQAGSFRAIKLYSDFGFRIIENCLDGLRPNEYRAAVDHLKVVMPHNAFARLQTTEAPQNFVDSIARQTHIEF
jgi:ribosomal protein S18 acetylase RimI-like enzyme